MGKEGKGNKQDLIGFLLRKGWGLLPLLNLIEQPQVACDKRPHLIGPSAIRSLLPLCALQAVGVHHSGAGDAPARQLRPPGWERLSEGLRLEDDSLRAGSRNWGIRRLQAPPCAAMGIHILRCQRIPAFRCARFPLATTSSSSHRGLRRSLCRASQTTRRHSRHTSPRLRHGSAGVLVLQSPSSCCWMDPRCDVPSGIHLAPPRQLLVPNAGLGSGFNSGRRPRASRSVCRGR